ncbi:MAG: protein TolQ [Gammaproteobacteria bacterium]|nr:MAG: protein TolQ [Gammaproteobacteria bacterium]
MELILNASLLVQMVMLLLLFMSIISWAFVFQKWRYLSRSKKIANHFEDSFWSGGNVTILFQNLQSRKRSAFGLEKIFAAGFSEFSKLKNQNSSYDYIIEGTQRAMRIALSRESSNVEHTLPFLATVASVSPYIGLFGTVWGIMNSFKALSANTGATISMVAPGIAEALIATAMGLFAAIPAVIAYNRFSSSADNLISRYENFSEEFTNILNRQLSLKQIDNIS